MPFKNIGFHRPADPGDESPEGNGIRIQWTKGESGHVQLVTAPMINGMPEGTFLDSTEAKWTILSRHEINETIRALRQARDDAFGKDE